MVFIASSPCIWRILSSPNSDVILLLFYEVEFNDLGVDWT